MYRRSFAGDVRKTAQVAPLLVAVGSVMWVHGFRRARQFYVVPEYREDSFAGTRIVRDHVEHGARAKCTSVLSAVVGIGHPSHPLHTAVSIAPMPCFQVEGAVSAECNNNLVWLSHTPLTMTLSRGKSHESEKTSAIHWWIYSQVEFHYARRHSGFLKEHAGEQI